MDCTILRRLAAERALASLAFEDAKKRVVEAETAYNLALANGSHDACIEAPQPLFVLVPKYGLSATTTVTPKKQSGLFGKLMGRAFGA